MFARVAVGVSRLSWVVNRKGPTVFWGAVILCLLVGFSAFAMSRRLTSFQAEHEQAMAIMEDISAVSDPLQQEREPDPADLLRLAENPITRGELHCVLRFLKRPDLFPQGFDNPESLAESDMIRRLALPDQLGAAPHVLEFVETVQRQTDSGAADYFVFRFRADETHSLAESGWLAGVAGPYFAENPDREPVPPGTFSRLDPIDARTANEHVAFSHEVLYDRHLRQLKQTKSSD